MRAPAAAYRRDQLLVPLPLQNADHQVRHRAALGLGNRLFKFASGRRRQIHHAFRQAAAHRDFFHVDVRRVQEPARFGHGDHRQRIDAAMRADGRAFQRVERDVDLRPAARRIADFFADIQHGRLVALAFADDYRAVDGQPVKRLAHGVDRCLVGGLLIAAPHPARRRQRRRFGDAHGFERKVALHGEMFGFGSAVGFGSIHNALLPNVISLTGVAYSKGKSIQD